MNSSRSTDGRGNRVDISASFFCRYLEQYKELSGPAMLNTCGLDRRTFRSWRKSIKRPHAEQPDPTEVGILAKVSLRSLQRVVEKLNIQPENSLLPRDTVAAVWASPNYDTTTPLCLVHWLEWSQFLDLRGIPLRRPNSTNDFSVDEFFIPLRTTNTEELATDDTGESTRPPNVEIESRVSVELQSVLHGHRRVLIVGPPGSGKTTFFKRIAYLACRNYLCSDSTEFSSSLSLPTSTFPLVVRIPFMADFLATATTRQSKDSPKWLTDYLMVRNSDLGWGLTEKFFEDKLEAGDALVLLDGLDEVSDSQLQEQIATIIANCAMRYSESRFVVTTRPRANAGINALTRFRQFLIDPLTEEPVLEFIHAISREMIAEDPNTAQEHTSRIRKAVASSRDIQRMSRNPVMLTALLAVYWNKRKLPVEKGDLYHLVCEWLDEARDTPQYRGHAFRALAMLQELALSMQDYPKGRQVFIGRRAASEALESSRHLRQFESCERLDAAESYLEQQELKTGIIVSGDKGIQFWHLTFQEYLAACALGSKTDDSLEDVLKRHGASLYGPDWRETILLLADWFLRERMDERLERLLRILSEIIVSLPSLEDKANLFGLFLEIQRDASNRGFAVEDAKVTAIMTKARNDVTAAEHSSISLEARLEASSFLPSSNEIKENRWVNIDGGQFLMGAQREREDRANYDPRARKQESPVHSVRLESFALGRYQVTVEEFAVFIARGGYEQEEYWDVWPIPDHWHAQPAEWDAQVERISDPVVGVSWYEAAAFSRWSNARLPTEAEWEYAARGKSGRLHPWGKEPPTPKLLNFFGSGLSQTTPVGFYEAGATPEGVFDMAGNVSEWCHDWFSAYTSDEQMNPQGPDNGQHKVARGGGFDNSENYVRSAYRHCYLPLDERDPDVGFRMARSIKPEEKPNE